ncbi:MAG TPA: DUF6471 domain-containing protein [Roseiarcus sp.]|nr:DUF6471 domain-containing protein [Roseiarcus sp.]
MRGQAINFGLEADVRRRLDLQVAALLVLMQIASERALNSIASKLKRGTFAATFWLGCLAALEMEGLRLGDI